MSNAPLTETVDVFYKGRRVLHCLNEDLMFWENAPSYFVGVLFANLKSKLVKTQSSLPHPLDSGLVGEVLS